MSRNSLLETGAISELSVRLGIKWLWVRIPSCHLNRYQISDIAHVSSKEFLDIQATIGCRFILKHVRDVIITYSQMHRTNKYSTTQLSHLTILAKWSSVRLRTNWLWVRIPLWSLFVSQ